MMVTLWLLYGYSMINSGQYTNTWVLNLGSNTIEGKKFEKHCRSHTFGTSYSDQSHDLIILPCAISVDIEIR